MSIATDSTLDPADWEAARALGHRMIDDAVDYLRNVRERPAWSPIPDAILDTYQAPLPQGPMPTEDVYAEFQRTILPYPCGNNHPRFFGWVHGTGTFTGALADLMASVMNANCAIGAHSAMYIDRQVIGWCKEILNFPRDAGGLLVSGGSMANLTALTVARQSVLEAREAAPKRRRQGRLIAYGSSETHQCITKAIRVLGLGTEGFCPIPVDKHFRIRTDLLREKIKADKNAGRSPFCIVANAGTVNTGAIDPLKDLADLANKEGLWLHIDGAFGALARLSPKHAEALQPISLADSVAFDLHKWMYMPYEVGCVLVRDAALQRRTFAAPANYLLAHERGLASGPDAYGNQGIELSRGFKALKVWMSLKEHGISRYAQLIQQNIAQAAYLGSLIAQTPDLELLAEVTLNVVCFRYKFDTNADALNKELLMRLQESGIAAPSYTMLHGHYALRVAITNHRTRMKDMDILVAAVREIGATLVE